MCTTRCPNVCCCGVGRKSYLSAGISSAPATMFFAEVCSSWRTASETGVALELADGPPAGGAACCAYEKRGEIHANSITAAPRTNAFFIFVPPISHLQASLGISPGPEDNPRPRRRQALPPSGGD